MPMDELDEIEKKALEEAKSAADLKDRVQALEIAKAITEKRKMMKETEKIDLDAKQASREYKFARTKHWASTLTPLLAVVLTMATLLVQSKQFSDSSKQQSDQFAANAKLQIAANEESQWRDGIKNLSMKDASTTLVSAFGMHSFFDSPNYSTQARNIAATLLPQLDNPDGFDNIFFDLTDTANTANQGHVIAIAKTLFNSQMDLYGINVHANTPALPNFQTLKEMLGDDDPPKFIQADAASRRLAGARAWMLDSASDGLNDIWVSKSASPLGTDLNGVVLENGQFEGLDFSNAILQGGALYNADFKKAKFTGAVFSRKLVANVFLDGADLSGIEEFADSKWQNSNWWKANCISKELLAYLEMNDSSASPENKRAGSSIACH